MILENSNKSPLEQYTELSKNSLIKVQFSCGGNSTCIDEPEIIPIVTDSDLSEIPVSYTIANEEDVIEIVSLLKTNNLPTSDLGTGKRIFIVAKSDGNIIGCVAMEIYETMGLLRSLAVKQDFRGNGIGLMLVEKAENWSRENGLKNLYLLTTSAAGFFTKMGWQNTERSVVPENIATCSEFSHLCPTTAICMSKTK